MVCRSGDGSIIDEDRRRAGSSSSEDRRRSGVSYANLLSLVSTTVSLGMDSACRSNRDYHVSTSSSRRGLDKNFLLVVPGEELVKKHRAVGFDGVAFCSAF